MAEMDDDAVLHKVTSPSIRDQCHAAWVVAGLAARDWAGKATEHVPGPVRQAARDVMFMLDVATPDALYYRPRRRRRQRVELRKPR